ncbi:hypothetical protein FLAVO9AF_70128 [Flavobacterium sp. 9AF]|nr:hypothetical protein FLAVO9AF_70128 [Flavobacterium sp. 9AF]
MLSRIFNFLINISFIWYFISSVILAVVVYPFEESHNGLFVMTRLLSFILFYFSIVVLVFKEK